MRQSNKNPFPLFILLAMMLAGCSGDAPEGAFYA